MWEYSPPGGGGNVAVEFLALCSDPLECDLSGRQGMVHCLSVSPPYPPPIFAGEGEIPG